jgi:hypothetical protein
MKTRLTFARNTSLNTLGFLMTLLFATLAFSTSYAQSEKMSPTEMPQNQRTIKGVVSNYEGPLESASVILKGTKIGTSTDSNGEFTFPKQLKTGDVLLVSYLGFETLEVKIPGNSDFLRLTMTDDLIEFIGALNTNTPYKSKRSK